MMPDPPLYNSRIVKSYIDHIKKNYPDIDTHYFLNHAGITSYQLNDSGHWFTQSQLDRFYETLSKKLNNFDIAREVGRNFPLLQASAGILQFTLGLVDVSSAFKFIEKLYPKISRACQIESKTISSNSIEILVKPRPGVCEKKYQCEYRQGIFEAVTKLFTNRNLKIEHPECLSEKGDHGRYVVSWQRGLSSILKKIRNLSLFLSLIISLMLLFFLPIGHWFILFLFLTTLTLGITFIVERLNCMELAYALTSEGNSAKYLKDKINVNYNNAIIIQEISQAASSILEIEKLLKFIMETFEKRLDFDRGIIMLANKKRTRLKFTTGYGYSEDLERLLKETEFNLENPGSRGEFIIAFKEQRPFLISDVGSIEKDLSPLSIDFMRALRTHSFICVPIVYEGKSEGILAVDNVRSKRPLRQSDLNLLRGIATQIGISINNARSYQLICEREQYFRALNDNAPDIIYTIDTSGKFKFINPSWKKILGHQKEEVIGRNFFQFIKKEDRRTCLELFKRVRDGKETIRNFPGKLLHKNGSLRSFNMNSAPQFDINGNVIGLVGIFKDITDQQKMEIELRQSHKMQAIGTMSAGIAHDFNNILTPMMGYIELLMMEVPRKSRTYRRLETVMNAVLRARELIKQILTFSRQTEIEKKPVQISSIINETLKLLKSSVPGSIKIKKNIGKIPIILGDPTQIQQIFMNLSANAFQAMAGKEGVLKISLEDVIIDKEFVERVPNSYPGHFARLTVSDTGHGMTPDVIERIFDPFFTTKHRSDGTGMGLSVVHGVVKDHRGFITVQSKQNSGTIFQIYFPAYEEKESFIEEKQQLSRGNEKILLVEDEFAVIEIEKKILESLGYKVTTKTGSLEALEFFQSNSDDFDLIITDMIMPDMNGDKLAEEIHRLNPIVPIILCSGDSKNMSKEKAEQIGIKATLNKPVLLKEFAKSIRTVLKNKFSSHNVSL